MGERKIEWHVVADVADIDAESPKSVIVGDRCIGLFEVKGEIYAIGNVCTHQFALLTDGYVEAEEYVECPLHQARFHIPTGKTQGPPADDDVKTYPTKVHEGRILVGIEDDS